MSKLDRGLYYFEFGFTALSGVALIIGGGFITTLSIMGIVGVAKSK